MKQNFSALFDHMDAEELDEVLAEVHAEPLEKGADRRIRAEVLARTGLRTKQTGRVPRRWRVIGTLAACLALVLALGTYAYAAENRTYHEAVRFFSENHLSTRGLTRGEIKAVYRDITTESFTHAKTAEVISSSLSTAHVDGYAIPQEIPDAMTPEEVRTLWLAYHTGQNQKGVHYAVDYVEKRAEDGTYMGLEKCLIGKYDGETLLWQFPITAYVADRYEAVSDGVIVWGQTDVTTSYQTRYAWMTKLDDSGREVWTKRLENGFRDEYICAMLEEDGGYAVISRGDLGTVCLNRYTVDGERTLVQKTKVGNYGVTNAARLGDGYLVQLSSWNTNEYARIIRLDHDGNLVDDFSYSAEDAQYYITDMAEFGGKVYLSAYAVPRLADGESSAGGRYEIAAVLNRLFENEVWEISGEELTPMVRANYTAMLLVCDPLGGKPETFYSVEGSLGGKLAVNDRGELLWDVESIASTFFSPATSSFTIGGTCQVYRYAFDGSGALVSQVKTDETTVYRR